MPFLSDIKKTLHDVKGIFGASVTLDKDYDKAYDQFTKHEKHLKSLTKSLNQYNEALTKLAAAQRKISKTLTKFFGEASDPTFQSYVNYNEGIANEIETHQKRFDNQIKVDPIATIDNYINQFQELHRRNDERNKRLYAYEKAAGQTKETGVEPTLQKDSYENLNSELQEDYKKIWDDRINFVNCLYPLIANAQITFFNEVSHTMESVRHIANTANGNAARNYPHSITPNSTSAMYGRFVSAQVAPATPSQQHAPSFGSTSQYSSSSNFNNNSNYGNNNYGNNNYGNNNNFGNNSNYGTNNNSWGAPQNDWSPSAPPESTVNSLRGPQPNPRPTLPPQPAQNPRNSLPPVPSRNFGPKPTRTGPTPPVRGVAPNPNARRGPPPPKRPQGGGVQARAKFDFNANESTELGFKKGDILTILSQQGEWWEAELNGQKGEIPGNYVTLL